MPNQAKRIFYRIVVSGLRTYARLACDFRVQGIDLIPPGPKIYVANHVASVDPYWAMAVLPDFLHFVVGPPYALTWLAPALDFFEQINAMPEQRKEVVDRACHWLARGEAVYIAPEGDVQPPFQPGHFYSGLAKIYRRSGAPVVPVATAVAPENIRRYPKWDIRVGDRNYEARMVWDGKICVAVGRPMYPQLRDDLYEEEDNRRITTEVRSVLCAMLENIRQTSFDGRV